MTDSQEVKFKIGSRSRDAADGWVHLRASNTEPIIRLISEAANDAAANALADRVAKAAGLP
jgi:phosphomannomutase